MVWPKGWVCQAVRAPGVKWTLAAASREGGDGVATVSMWTAPVNQSLGPGFVSRELRVICMVVLLLGCGKLPGDRHARRRRNYSPVSRLAPICSSVAAQLPSRRGAAIPSLIAGQLSRSLGLFDIALGYGTLAGLACRPRWPPHSRPMERTLPAPRHLQFIRHGGLKQAPGRAA